MTVIGGFTAYQLHSQAGGTFTVTTTADTTSGSTTSGSLRDGINAANSGACAAPCTINFGAGGTGRISTFSSFTITANDLRINGFSAAGASTNTAPFGSPISGGPTVEVTTSAGVATGFAVNGANVIIEGLAVNGFNVPIRLQSTFGTVRGCFIGTDTTGTTSGPFGTSFSGIQVTSASARIGGPAPADRNLIAATSSTGVEIVPTAGGNHVIEGNYIGTARNGTSDLSAASYGILMGGTAGGSVISTNLVSGHTFGICVNAVASGGPAIRANRVGTNGLGTGPVPNSSYGVYVINTVGTVIGGASAGDGNLISGNGSHGIFLDTNSTSSSVLNNKIGTNLAGTAAVGNGGQGIRVVSSNGTILGTSTAPNVIAGNTGEGIRVITSTAGVEIMGNTIGASGMPNNAGIWLENSANTRIHQNNQISFNAGDGVVVDDERGNEILNNSIHSNSGIGIDLMSLTGTFGVNDGPTANDAGDIDGSPGSAGNNYQNFPVINSAYVDGTTTSANLTARVTLDSAASTAGNAVLLFEADGDPTNPEGQRFLGSQCFNTSDLTNAAITIPAAGLTPGAKILASATSYTDGACSAVNDGTSEFSAAAAVALQPGFVVNTLDSGAGSLRQAILDANSGACASPCNITFNIPATDSGFAGGVFTIRTLSALPNVVASNTIIDGATQTAFTGNSNPGGPEVVVNGGLAGAGVAGFIVAALGPGQGTNIRISNLVINGFAAEGILISANSGNTAMNNVVTGNYIGTDPSGTSSVPNGGAGIHVIGINNTIGGTSPGAGNLISGNSEGVLLDGSFPGFPATGNQVFGNLIKGNGTGVLLSSAASNMIGGTGAGQGNTITLNSAAGVGVNDPTSTENSIRGNSIHSNGALGIDLNGDGVTPNDAGDSDTGPNGLQNFPVLTSITFNAAAFQTTVSGTLNSVPLSTFDLDWYSNGTADPAGFGEGETYEGTSTFTTDSLGNAAVSIVLTGNKLTSNITATASRATPGGRETSEFAAVIVNNPPVAGDDVASTPSNTPVTTNVLVNDSDPEAGTLTISGFTQGANGTVSCSTPNCTYTPNPNFVGTDTYTYTISDPGGLTDVAMVTVTVTNQAPVAANDAYGTNQNMPLNVAAPGVLSNDTDPEAAPLTAILVTGPASGTLTLNSNGSFTYTPNAGFTGTDSFTYRASDGSLNSNIANVTITVNNVNDAPVASNDSYATAEDTTLTVPAPGVLANDTDVDGDPLTASLITAPTRGSLSLASNGSFTYQPFANLNGADSFTYQVSDGSLFATATVTITVTAVNDPPVAIDDSASTPTGVPVTINVLSNDTDADGNPLSVSLFFQGSQGTVSCTTTGSCTYTPNTTATGSDSFIYKVSDGNGGFDDGMVFITITAACPNPPTLASPGAGATNVPTSGTMSWDGSAEQFEVFFGPVGRGCSMSQGSLPGNSFRYAGLESDTEYEWRVEAGRSGCPTVSSPCSKFRTVKTCTTAAPTPISPVPGANVSSPITFSWTAVAGATNYKVFATSGAGETLLGQTTTTSLIASLPDSASSWYVVAENVPGCGDLRSAPVSFRVCNAPERPLAAVIGESTSGQTYTVTWEAVPNASRYEVLEANNAAFVDAISFTTEALFMTFTKDNIQHATPFFYQVRAFSNCFNGPGASSPTIRVVVVPVPPRETPNTSANAPVGSTRPITIQVFVPGEPGRRFRFTAAGDQSWMTVRPESGDLPESGITLEVTVDPRNLPNGTFTGTVIVTLIEPTTGRISLHSNHTRSTPVSINLVTPVTPISSGPPIASSLIIPAVGHLDGSDARWRSDVRIANTSLNVSRYLLTFTPGNPAQGVKQTSLEVGPGVTTALDDIVRAWYGIGSLGESSNGALEVRPLKSGSNSTFKADPPNVSLATVVTSRTYAQTQSGTLGEFIPGILFSNFVGLAESGQPQPILNLQQIAQNQAYRTNVGVVEGSGNPVSVVLSIFDSAGNKLKDIPLGLKANEQRQLNSLLAENGIELADGRIEVKVTGGEGRVTAYAAVIDNRTRDQLFVPASTLGQFNSSRYVMPGIADLDTGSARWRSDMRIFNSGSTTQGATLTLYPQNNSGAPLTASVTVEPGEVEVLDNIVRTLFGTSNLGGAVHVDTPTESSLIVTARTYNQTTNGTLGLFIPAVTPQQAIGGGEKSLNLVQAEDSIRYRTNVGLAEVTGKPVTVEMMIHLPDSKVTPRIEIPLAGNEFRQIGVLRELGIGNVYNARVSMRVISGEGRITAYGSVIDMRTNDSTYVPAQ